MQGQMMVGRRREAALKILLLLVYVLALIKFVANRLARELAPLGALEVDRLNEAILNKLRDDVRQHGAKLLVAVIPLPLFQKGVDRSERFIEDWGRRAGVPVLMLRRVFLAMPRNEQARLYEGHWTVFGHRVAAEAISRTIVEQKLLAEAQVRR